jgi:tyrosyl-tRNA synthetase
MKVKTDRKKIEEILTRGVEEIIERESLKKKLKLGKQLRVKHGIDPTGPKIHLGRAFQFWKLKAFQEFGHKIVLIFGDFTGQIGDASDKLARRRPLSEQEIKENLKNYGQQIGKILDMSKVELRYNSEWLNKLSARELLSLSMRFSAQELIQRRNFKERWERGRTIGLHELDYPLLQGYDSVVVKADVETGGSDQLFNLKVGRKIQKMFGQKPQDIMTTEMLIGLDGRKMTTSWGNIITIVDSPDEMYGKIMSTKDELLPDYFELCTQLPLKEVRKVALDLKNKKINPRDLKAQLAREIVCLYHGREVVRKAEKEFERIFREKKFPSKIPEFKIKEKSLNLLDLLFKTKLAPSKSEAKRLILQKAVEINKILKEDWREMIEIEKEMVIKVGKRKFAKINQ